MRTERQPTGRVAGEDRHPGPHRRVAGGVDRVATPIARLGRRLGPLGCLEIWRHAPAVGEHEAGFGVRGREAGAREDHLPRERIEIAPQGDRLPPCPQWLDESGDQIRRVIERAARQGMLDRVRAHPVPLVPGCGAPVQLQYPVRGR